MTARVLPLPVYVAARDVVQQLGCSEAKAYQILRLAAGRPKGSRGMLRVPLARWSEFLEEKFACDCSDDGRAASRTGHGPGASRWVMKDLNLQPMD